MMVAGGGTGGHIFPGIAVSKKFLQRDKKNKVLYVGTKYGMEVDLVPKYGIDVELLPLGGIKGKSAFKKILNMFKVFVAVFRSMKIIREFGPSVIFGVGGYASYPAILAGKLLRIKTTILEQNTVAGLANRVLGLFVDRVYTAFDYTKRFFGPSKVLLTGNPIREEIAAVGASGIGKREKFVILVLGGSQGASRINEKVIEALENLKEYKTKLGFIHQTGKKDYESVKEGYDKKGFSADVLPFIDAIEDSFKRCDLVVSRSGSGICEIMAAGRPSILIPYPYSSYEHQEINAQVVVDGGAAVKISDAELNGEILSRTILDFYGDRQKLGEMAGNALKLARIDASEKIVGDLIALGDASA